MKGWHNVSNIVVAIHGARPIDYTEDMWLSSAQNTTVSCLQCWIVSFRVLYILSISRIPFQHSLAGDMHFLMSRRGGESGASLPMQLLTL